MSVSCYRDSYGEILNQTGKDSPCGSPNSTTPIVPCCANCDLCLTNGFCSYQKSLAGGSGYYVAGCTASSGLCPSYSGRCTSQFLPDVSWNSTLHLWQCCGVDDEGRPTCEDPTNERFIAPEPAELQTIFSVPTDGWSATSTSLKPASTRTIVMSPTTALSTSAVSSDIVSTSPSIPSSSSPSTSSQDGLSDGTKAGIGIGAALGVLAIVGLVIYLVFRKRRGKRSRAELDSKSLGQSHDQWFAELPDQNARPVEMTGEDSRKPVEMGTRESIHELETRRFIAQ